MQNAPAMLAQRMMNRQAPYGPVGMVSQNMSGNKKGGGSSASGPVIGLKFDTTNATAGTTFSNSDTKATLPTGTIGSAKANSTTTTSGTSAWYWEFSIESISNTLVGFGPSTFVCNTTDRVGLIANTVAYVTGNGNIIGGFGGTVLVTGPTSTLGDIIGFKLDLTPSSSTLTVLKNNVVIGSSNLNTTTYIPSSATAWVPIVSSVGASVCSATISNNIYSYAGYTPIGSSVTTIAASASVPAVADGKYDVYTFNASGTFTAGSTGAVRALVIAGGGGGISNNVGAGGAGGYQEKGVVATPQTYTITVGGGGGALSNGNNSAFSTVTAIGGGYGGSASAGNGGGSGGGGGADFPGPTAFGGGSGTTDQGNSGGSGGSTGTNLQPFGGGGGGGAGGVGGNATVASGIGGNGGAGKASDITGVSITRAGGGGGGASATPGTATGGGGTQTSAATVNTGGGSGSNGPNMTGGSGVVIIRVRARA